MSWARWMRVGVFVFVAGSVAIACEGDDGSAPGADGHAGTSGGSAGSGAAKDDASVTGGSSGAGAPGGADGFGGTFGTAGDSGASDGAAGTAASGGSAGIDGSAGTDAEIDGGTGTDAGIDGSAGTDSGIDGSTGTDAGANDPVPCAPIQTGGRVLLELGHSAAIRKFAAGAGRFASVDAAGRWVLWNAANNAIVATGESLAYRIRGAETLDYEPAFDVAGDRLLVQASATALELRRLSDGGLVATLPFDARFCTPGCVVVSRAGLATDGSYVWAANTTGVYFWSKSGAALGSHVGRPLDPPFGYYPDIHAFAEPTALRVVPVGQTDQGRVESIDPSTGAATTSAAYSGIFSGWFSGAPRFFTRTGNTLRIYSGAVVQQQIINFASMDDYAFGGYGEYFWNETAGNPDLKETLSVYRVGNAAPVLSVQVGRGTPPLLSGHHLLSFDIGPDSITARTTPARVIDLSGPPVVTGATTLAWYDSGSFRFGSTGTGSVLFGDKNGVIFQRPANAASTRPSVPINCGKASSIAATPSGRVAVATAAGQVLVMDVVPSRTLERVLDYRSGKVMLSADGSILVVGAALTDTNIETYVFPNDGSLRLLSLPSGSEIHVFRHTVLQSELKYVFDFHLTADGQRLARWTCERVQDYYQCDYALTSLDGSVSHASTSARMFSRLVEWFPYLVRFSPDGRSIAFVEGLGYDSVLKREAFALNLFTDGMIRGTALGHPIGWVSNEALLTQNSFYWYTGPTVASPLVDRAGTVLRTLNLLPTGRVIGIGDGRSIYVPEDAAIFDTVTNAATWRGTPNTSKDRASLQVGAYGGTYVISADGPQVRVEPITP